MTYPTSRWEPSPRFPTSINFRDVDCPSLFTKSHELIQQLGILSVRSAHLGDSCRAYRWRRFRKCLAWCRLSCGVCVVCGVIFLSRSLEDLMCFPPLCAHSHRLSSLFPHVCPLYPRGLNSGSWNRSCCGFGWTSWTRHWEGQVGRRCPGSGRPFGGRTEMPLPSAASCADA